MRTNMEDQQTQKRRLDVKAIKERMKALQEKIVAGKRENKKRQRAFSKSSLSVWEWNKQEGEYPPHSPKCGLFYEIDEATSLYSLRAHMRGRLHMTQRDGLPWTMEDQADLAELYIEDYVLDGEE